MDVLERMEDREDRVESMRRLASRAAAMQERREEPPLSRRRLEADLTEAFMAAAPGALERLTELVESRKEAVALRAVEIILDRVLGKPVQAAQVEMDLRGQMDVRAQIHAALLEALRRKEIPDGNGKSS